MKEDNTKIFWGKKNHPHPLTRGSILLCGNNLKTVVVVVGRGMGVEVVRACNPSSQEEGRLRRRVLGYPMSY